VGPAWQRPKPAGEVAGGWRCAAGLRAGWKWKRAESEVVGPLGNRKVFPKANSYI
jgi:hypothetical protein